MSADTRHAKRARSRARERHWAPTSERAEMLSALSELFADDDVTPDCAIEASAVVLAELLGDGVIIDLLSPERDRMFAVGAYHPDPRARGVMARAATRTPFRADRGFTANVLETGRSLLIPAVTTAEMAALQPDLAPVSEALGTRGFVLAPMLARGRCVGFVWQVRTRPEPQLDDDERRFLDEVAVRLALQVESWRQGEALELAGPAQGRLDGVLTSREREIVGQIAQGAGDRTIAARLGLSPRTVEWYRHRIQRRLGVPTRAALVAFVRDPAGARGT
jgi:DNA-binding CsgD family transcriptional regulator